MPPDNDVVLRKPLYMCQEVTTQAQSSLLLTAQFATFWLQSRTNSKCAVPPETCKRPPNESMLKKHHAHAKRKRNEKATPLGMLQ